MYYKGHFDRYKRFKSALYFGPDYFENMFRVLETGTRRLLLFQRPEKLFERRIKPSYTVCTYDDGSAWCFCNRARLNGYRNRRYMSHTPWPIFHARHLHSIWNT